MTKESESLNIYQRLNEIQSELIKSGVGKHGEAPQIMGGYAYTKADDAFERITSLFVKYGVCFVPKVMNNELITVANDDKGNSKKFQSKVSLTIDYINIDNPDQWVTQFWSGEAVDTSDKSTQKAATSGVKYALLKKFLVGDNEDTEAEEFIEEANAVVKIEAAKSEQTKEFPSEWNPPQDPKRLAAYKEIIKRDNAYDIIHEMLKKSKSSSPEYVKLSIYEETLAGLKNG